MRIVVALGGQRPAAARPADDRREPAPERARRRRGARAGGGGQRAGDPHGNGPQVGLLALQGAAYKEVETYPLDVLGAETEGMIGYMIEQELGNLLPFERPFATHPDDDRGRSGRPGVRQPDQVHRPGLRRDEAERLAGREGLGDQAGRRQMAPRRRLAAAQADLRDPADPVAARARRGRDLHRRRRHPDDVRAGHEHARRRRGRDRQGPRQRAARPSSSTPTCS